MGVAPMSPRSSLPDHRLMGAKHASTSARAGAWMSSRGSATAHLLPWSTADLGCGARATSYVLPGDALPRCSLRRPPRQRIQRVPSLRASGRRGACAKQNLAADQNWRRWRGVSRSPEGGLLCFDERLSDPCTSSTWDGPGRPPGRTRFQNGVRPRGSPLPRRSRGATLDPAGG
jgi:hypothetical protein